MIDTRYSYEVPEGWHLFYSGMAAERTGCVVYENGEGEQVKVTFVARSETLDPKICSNPDVEYRGKAVRYIGKEMA